MDDSSALQFMGAFLDKNPEAAWIGTLFGDCEKVRALLLKGGSRRSVCVYDTAENGNRWHAEMFQAHDMPHDDQIELRNELLKLFDGDHPVSQTAYRNGYVWGALSEEHRTRTTA